MCYWYSHVLLVYAHLQTAGDRVRVVDELIIILEIGQVETAGLVAVRLAGVVLLDHLICLQIEEHLQLLHFRRGAGHSEEALLVQVLVEHADAVLEHDGELTIRELGVLDQRGTEDRLLIGAHCHRARRNIEGEREQENE